MPSGNPKITIGLWLLLGCFMMFVIVLIGGITRLTGSGLSITDWNLIMGAIPPLQQADWELVFDRYKQFPQFRQVNFDMSLQEFKSIFWWEYIHRMWGRLIGLVFIFPLLWFVAKRMLSRKLLLKILLAGVLGGLQGALGWYMVKSGLVDKPWVSPYRLTAHLFMALAAFSYTLWLALDLLMPYKPVVTPRSMRKLTYWIFFALVLQIGLGGFMAGTKAAIFYPSWPLMDGKLIAESIFNRSPWLLNFFENPATIQFMHRSLAYIIVLAISWLWISDRREPVGGVEGLAIQGMGALVLTQLVLGIIVLLNSQGSVSAFWGVLHQAGAVALLSCALFLCHRFLQDAPVKHHQGKG